MTQNYIDQLVKAFMSEHFVAPRRQLDMVVGLHAHLEALLQRCVEVA